MVLVCFSGERIIISMWGFFFSFPGIREGGGLNLCSVVLPTVRTWPFYCFIITKIFLLNLQI